MRIEKYKCDHCGKSLDEDRDYIDSEIDMGICRVDADLCEECAEELKKMITSFLNTEKEVTHEAPTHEWWGGCPYC